MFTDEKILIVDDDVHSLNVLLELFKDAPFTTLVATSGEKALEMALYIIPDLILLDIMMKGIDGFESARRLKSINKLKDIPVIFMTALSDTSDKLKGFEAGCVDYVTKPYRNEEVLARVNTHLMIRRQKLALEKINSVLEHKNKLIQSNLDMAKNIQLGMIPKQLPDNMLFEARGIYKPVEELGGDFYDLHLETDKKLHFYISDVSGHGVSSALIAILQKPLVAGYFHSGSKPGDSLTGINKNVNRYLEKDGYFFTAVYGCIDFEKMNLEYSIAAHPDILILRKDNTVIEIPAGKKDMLIGPFQGIEYRTFEEKIFQGDILVLYTDGIIEAMNQNHELYGSKRMISALESARASGPQGMIDSVLQSLSDYTEKVNQDDDVTMLVIEIF